MKKLFALCMTAFLAITAMTSCEESAEKKDQAVAYKIENRDSLTQDDYARAIEYVGAYAEKAQKYVDMEINADNQAEAASGLASLKEEYPLLDTFRDCIRLTPVSALSEDNVKLCEKYAGLIEFSAPSGLDIATAPCCDAGLEEQTPDSTDGVVAAPVDTVQVKN